MSISEKERLKLKAKLLEKGGVYEQFLDQMEKVHNSNIPLPKLTPKKT